MLEGRVTLENMSQAIWYNRWTANQFKPFIEGVILEIGCGIGNFTRLLTKYGSVYAIDIEKDYINSARKKTKKALIGFGDIEKGGYFFKKRLFSTIVCLNVLEHIKDDKKAINNIYKLLRPDGHLILLVPSHKFLYGQIDKAINHFRRYNQKELLKILEFAGFEIVKSKRLNILGAIGWWFSGKVLKENNVKVSAIKLFNILGPAFLTIENIIEPPFGTSILIVAKKGNK